MNINDSSTLEQLEQFLSGTQTVAWVVASSKAEIYRDIQRTPVKFQYPLQDKRSKGVVVRFLMQKARLIKQ